MPKKAKRKITAWSYSRLKLYDQCPLKFKLKNIDKLPEPKSPHAQRGIDIHKKAEDYLLGKINRVPSEFDGFSRQLRELRNAQATPEGKWAFDINWEWLDDFFDSEVWVRQILDAHYFINDTTLRVIDFKTGRIYDDYEDQMMMFATGAFSMYEGVEEVITELWYVDQPVKGGKNPIISKYKISEYPHLLKHWKNRVKPLFNDKKFAPKKNKYCNYCHFRKDNGGPCKY